MPIYEFKCKICGHILEYLYLQSDDKDQVICPSCGHGGAETLLSNFSSKSSMTPSSYSPSGGLS